MGVLVIGPGVHCALYRWDCTVGLHPFRPWRNPSRSNPHSQTPRVQGAKRNVEPHPLITVYRMSASKSVVSLAYSRAKLRKRALPVLRRSLVKV